MDLVFENQLAADLTALAKAQRATGRAAFDDDEHRERVRTALERVLVDGDNFRTYDRLLTEICRDRIEYLDEFPEAVFEEIVMAGLGQIDPGWLARLVLDPIWVRMLSDEISKRFPEAWWDAMGRNGERLRAEHRQGSTVVSRPSVETMESADSRWATPYSMPLNKGAEKPASGGAADAGPVWHRPFSITPQDGKWHSGSPADVGQQTAEVDLEWSAENGLTVALSGFLKLGPGYAVEATWVSISSGELSEARDSVGNLDRLLTLKHPDGRSPQPGDRLGFLHRRLPSARSGWELSVEIVLKDTDFPAQGSGE